MPAVLYFLVEIVEFHIDLKLRRLTVYLSNLDLSSIDKNKLPKKEFILALVPVWEPMMVKKERKEPDK